MAWGLKAAVGYVDLLMGSRLRSATVWLLGSREATVGSGQ